jgi:hypothetical protein
LISKARANKKGIALVPRKKICLASVVAKTQIKLEFLIVSISRAIKII